MGVIDNLLYFFLIVIGCEVIFVVRFVDVYIKYFGAVLKCVVEYCGIVFVEVY